MTDTSLGLTTATSTSPMGFALVHLRIPTSNFFQPELERMTADLTRAWLRAGAEHGALVGFVTRFEEVVEPDYLERSLFLALVAQDWNDVVDAGWEWFIVGAPLFGKVPIDPDWITASTTEHGVFFQREDTLHPWAQGGAA